MTDNNIKPTDSTKNYLETDDIPKAIHSPPCSQNNVDQIKDNTEKKN